MQTICWTGLRIIIILMKRHRARWLMGYKDFTFLSHSFKFSSIDREQKFNSRTIKWNNCWRLAVDLHHVDCDLALFFSFENRDCLKLRVQHRKMTAE